MNSFEDVEIGSSVEIGSHAFAADEIIAFARRWDPQPFHIDPEAAKLSLFGGLVASGWHTACMWMRLNVADGRRRAAQAIAAGLEPPRYGPSPGIADVRWPRPVFAGDTVSYGWTITATRPLASRPEWGLVEYAAHGTNQNGEPVLSFTGKVFMGRRRA